MIFYTDPEIYPLETQTKHYSFNLFFGAAMPAALKGYKGPDDWIQLLREKDNEKEQANE